ncbi:TetR family transcriptional regulator [Streptomyces flaveolus]|uniref:TetR/AcrR family transcriptional regulator n=1 Tax=Streptomyces flaveolus TaxID=67297 RepID=UPI0034011372
MTGNRETAPENERAARRSSRTRVAILDAARRRFAEQGYDRTTIRAVAADAKIDPSMVMRYYGSKERLFEAALTVDLHLPDLTAVPREQLPRTLVLTFLDRWERAPAGDTLLVLLRSAVTADHAAARMREIFADQVGPALAPVIGPQGAPAQAALVASQLLGLALGRYILRIPSLTHPSPEEIADLLAPAIAATLD